MVADAAGAELSRIPFQAGWGSIAQWLNNDWIVIRRAKPADDWYSTQAAFLVVNPFTGESQPLPADPPDLFALHPVPQWDGLGIISYNPARTQRVYWSNREDTVLEDLRTGKMIGRYATTSEPAPVWSPVGQFVAMVRIGQYDDGPAGLELYLVDLNGREHRLTELSVTHPRVAFHRMVWSADGDKLAVQVLLDREQPTVHFGVVDLPSSQVVIYDLETSLTHDPDLVWSPNGHYLLVEGTNSAGGQILLVDLAAGTVAPLIEAWSLAGWLDSPVE